MRKLTLSVIGLCVAWLWLGAETENAKSPQAAASRFIDNGDGTVSDPSAGLMWEKKTGTPFGAPDPSDVRNVNNTYAWCAGSGPYSSCTNKEGLADGPAFTVFLATLNNGRAFYQGQNPGPPTGCFANHCDWRLPSAVELQGILEDHNCCIDPVFGATEPDRYWSANTDGMSTVAAMTVNFKLGDVDDAEKVSSLYVRAVRSITAGGAGLKQGQPK